MTFTSDSEWTVPYGVKSISVDCVGSQGFSNSQASGGKGGRVQCTLTPQAGQTLYIVTGKRSGSVASAVYNASDIRTVSGDLSSRIVVAGGGGNCSLNTKDGTYSTGGAGGGLVGGAATNVTRTRGGQGGTQTAGGAGGTRIDTGAGANGNAGSFGLGGAGYSATTNGGGTGGSGAGGAGYYGGGSGAHYEYYGWNCAGGGGGSSYTDESLCSEVVHTQGYQEGVGYVTIFFETDEYMEVDKIKDIYKSTERKYYKYGTEPNATVVGSPTIVDGVVSGFTTANYLKLPNTFNPSGTWEVVVDFKLSQLGKSNSIFGTTTQYDGTTLYVASDNKLSFYVSSNGTSWDVASAVRGTIVFTTGVNYTVKIVFDGDKYTVAVSTEGGEFVTDITVSSTKIVFGSPCALGGGISTNTSGDQLSGSIDLAKSYIKINDKMWWYGTKAVETTEDDAVYSDVPKKRIVAAYKTGKRKYYKYVFQDWTQPKATANTTAIDGGNMVFTASSTYSTWKAYGPLDGLTSGERNGWIPSNTSSAWWQVKFPYKLKITGLKHYNAEAESSIAITSGRFYTDSTMTTPIGNSFSTPNTDWYATTVSGIPAEGVITDTIYFSRTGSGYSGIGELVITAQREVVVETSPEDDYDYSVVEPQLVYNLKYNLNTSSAYTLVGTVSGTDKFGTDKGQSSTTSLNQTSTFTFNTPAPSGKWTGKFIYYSQVNFTMSQVYWQLTYDDGTKEYAYGPKSLGDTANGGGETATISLSFTATKPIKTVTVYAKGAGSGNGCYGGLGSVQMFFDGSTQ